LFQVNPGDWSRILVRERMATYTSGINVCGYQSELAWSGGQGIIVGSLVDWLIQTDKQSKQRALLYRRDASQCVAQVTTNSFQGVLLPWTNGEGGDAADYATGIGVFMRYLLYADQNNQDCEKSRAVPTIGR
jgi:hypothetical protein